MTMLFAAIGSEGDLGPMLAIGQAVQKRGEQVVILANPAETKTITNAGLTIAPVGEPMETKQLLQTKPAFMGIRGSELVMRHLVKPAIPLFHAAAQEAIQKWQPRQVLCHPLVIGAKIAAQQAAVPVTIMHLAPISWLNHQDLDHYQGFSKWLMRHLLPFADKRLAKLIRPECQSIGTQEPDYGLYRSFLEGDHILGMWSPVFRSPHADDPANSVTCGVPTPYSATETVPAEVEHFLTSDSAPIVIGLGSTAIHIAEQLTHRIVTACKANGKRCLQIGGTAQAHNSSDYLHVERANHRAVFPRAAINIVHGGIGSTHAALAAGRPTIVLPFGHDQFDNARRVAALGCGVHCWQARASVKRIRSFFTRLNDASYSNRAREIADRMNKEGDGASAAADILLQKQA